MSHLFGITRLLLPGLRGARIERIDAYWLVGTSSKRVTKKKVNKELQHSMHTLVLYSLV